VIRQALVAGGGIGGLAAAVACTYAGWEARVLEQAPEFGEAGAGIQLGPNATRVLHEWGLEDQLAAVAAFPDQLQVMGALDGKPLARLRLGEHFVRRYQAPYATVHRADLHALLLAAARERGVDLRAGKRLTGFTQGERAVAVTTQDGLEIEGDALVGADGLWSVVRQAALADGPPQPTGHLAYRAMVRQGSLPPARRSSQVTAWLGPRLHVVAYPVRAGEWLNVVAIVHGEPPEDAGNWDHRASPGDLHESLAGTCRALRDLLEAAPEWRMWTLHDRPAVAAPEAMSQGLVALLGDAAHPMRPYLAQGAAMALEDATQLGHVLSMADGRVVSVRTALRRYALNRWERCAKVQERAQRNGQIFHAEGFVQKARDVSLKVLGEKLLDVPWLYRGPA
jgi:salicylate hydroxylase